MKTRVSILVVTSLLLLLAFRPPLVSVAAEENDHRRELHHLQSRIEAALDAGRLHEARELGHELAVRLRELPEMGHEEGDDREEHHGEADRHAHELERHHHEIAVHLHELEVRRNEIELQRSELELKMGRVEFLDNPVAVALDAIDMATMHLGEEEAVDFFSEMLDQTEIAPVRQRLRQRLVELNLEMDRRGEATEHLRSLILATDR